MYGLLLEARRADGVKECYPFGASHHLVVAEGFDAGAFGRLLRQRGFESVTVEPVQAGIEDVFMKLMQR